MFNIKTKLKINVFVFLLALFVGLLFVYVSTPEPDIIIKYPSIHNAHKIIYNEENNDDICFNFIPKQIDCDDT